MASSVIGLPLRHNLVAQHTIYTRAILGIRLLCLLPITHTRLSLRSPIYASRILSIPLPLISQTTVLLPWILSTGMFRIGDL